MKAAFYLRVSTAAQDTDNQLIQLQREATAKGYEIVSTYQEKESAFSLNSKQSQLEACLLAAQGHNFDILFVAALDRLTRRGPLTALQLVKRFNSYGVKVISLAEPFITDNSMSDVFIAITAWAAEWESKIKQQRIKAGNARRVAAGGKLGRQSGAKDKTTTTRDRAGYVARWDRWRKERVLNKLGEKSTSENTVGTMD